MIPPTSRLVQYIEYCKYQELRNKNIVAEIHNALMLKYGWIPLEEFKKTPIVTVLNLLSLSKENRYGTPK